MKQFRYAANCGVTYGYFPLFTSLGFGNAFSCRMNGQSDIVEKGFNLALHVGDNQDKVLKNRARYAESLGLDNARFTTCEQVHGTNVVVVNKVNLGSGAFDYSESIKNADALVTAQAQIPLLLFFADCVPVIFADPVRKAIGIAHAGWRGTVGDIACITAKTMMSELGCQANNIIAAIGPSIGKCCYKVDEMVWQAGKKHADCFVPLDTGEYELDLQKWNRLSLVESGVQESNIFCADVCTCCNNERFFSYRAENMKTGRMGVVLWRK